MAYQALARKWRPRTFSQMVGQEHVVKALTHALERDRTHHAYLFTGTRGVGKTSLARILAKALNCENRQTFDPCCACSACTEIDEGRFMDLIEVDAASRTKVEDTRDLLENVQYLPNKGRYKIYLIDEVHMLTGHSFNALLKTLEEPPEHVKFLLATTDPQKIPVTVLSRCLQFNLKRMLPEQIAGQMAYVLEQENIAFETEALRALSIAADGSMRDGLSLLDQAIVHGAGDVRSEAVYAMLGAVPREPIFNLLRALADNDGPMALARVAALDEHALDFADVLQQLLLVLHHVALAQHWPDTARADEHAEVLQELARRLTPEDVQLYYQIGLLCRRDLPYAPDPRSGFEMALLRMLTFQPVAKATSRDAGMPVTPQAAVVAAAPAAVQCPQAPPSPLRPTDAQPQNWLQIIQTMGLAGMTHQLASNCLLHEVTEQACTLLLDAGHQHLRTGQVVNNLQKALQAYFGRPIKLVIQESAGGMQETPALHLARAKAERQRAAEQEIEEDGTVAAFKELLDAKVLHDFTQPLD
ncbi:MAG: DNA polymerase III subunit gamma/tau [Methylococcaceae bacterium]|nr:MAG: DNA polymerase III subunit gamma/tau [Methylococcaceae bacterium]